VDIRFTPYLNSVLWERPPEFGSLLTYLMIFLSWNKLSVCGPGYTQVFFLQIQPIIIIIIIFFLFIYLNMYIPSISVLFYESRTVKLHLHMWSLWIQAVVMVSLTVHLAHAVGQVTFDIFLPWFLIRPPLLSSGQSSWLQIRRHGFDSQHYQKKKVVGLERGPLSLVGTTEELLDRKVVAPV
jgi:hypothetical protein